MIGGISSQVGFTEEKSDLLPLRPPPDKGFDRALEHATQSRPDAPPSSKTASESRHVARRRALAEEREDEPRAVRRDSATPAKQEKVAGGDGKKLPAESTSAEGRESIQGHAPSDSASEADQAAAYPDGTVLEDASIDPEQAARSAQVAHLAGIGLVAYQQSPHGLGEQEAAEEFGLMLKPPVQRVAAETLNVAAQAVEPGTLLQKVEPEEQLPVQTPRQLFSELVQVANPEDLPEEAQDQSNAKAESKGDAGRLALLNAMRQPPPGAHAAHVAAFGMEGGAGLKEPKSQGDSPEGGRMAILTTARNGEATQTPATVPNLGAPDRAAFAVLQKPDRSEPPLMERVAQDVRWMIRNNRSEATIRLEPDHLGSMRIKVVHSDGTLRIDMTVDNPQARGLIESRMSDLQQRLNLHDLGAEQFSFNVNVQEGGGWDSFKQPAHTARAMPYLPASRDSGAGETMISASLSRPIWGRAGVGIYV